MKRKWPRADRSEMQRPGYTPIPEHCNLVYEVVGHCTTRCVPVLARRGWASVKLPVCPRGERDCNGVQERWHAPLLSDQRSAGGFSLVSDNLSAHGAEMVCQRQPAIN